MRISQKVLFNLFEKSISFLFPSTCPVCGQDVVSHGELCAQCWSKFNWIGNPKCYKCGYPFSANLDLGSRPLCPVCAAGQCELDFIRSACVYDEASRAVMLPFKHSGKLHYGVFMSRAMLSAAKDLEIVPDVIMPVPLARRRLFKRSYNQAMVLSRPISRALNIPTDINSVCRIYRPDMGHKNASARAENIRGVFDVKNPSAITGKNILLIDDVMTTGATFSELRKVLIRAGAKSVSGLVFCRVVRAI